MNYNNQIAAPDEKLVFAEPEMEVVLFDENDVPTTFDSNSGFGNSGFGGEEDGFGIPEI